VGGGSKNRSLGQTQDFVVFIV